jgi:hypothetical protein
MLYEVQTATGGSQDRPGSVPFKNVIRKCKVHDTFSLHESSVRRLRGEFVQIALALRFLSILPIDHHRFLIRQRRGNKGFSTPASLKVTKKTKFLAPAWFPLLPSVHLFCFFSPSTMAISAGVRL